MKTNKVMQKKLEQDLAIKKSEAIGRLSGEKTFNFWRDNKIANHYTLTETALKEKFINYLKTKEKDWLEYYSTRDITVDFIGRFLNSVGNDANGWKEINELAEILKPIKNDYLDTLKS